LPTELIVSISNYILEDERSQSRQSWERDYRCYELTCELEDHLPACEVAELREKIECDDKFRQDFCGGKTNIDECVEVYLAGREDKSLDEHFDRRSEWRERMPEDVRRESTFFQLHSELILKHFALSIRTSNIYCPDDSDAKISWIDAGHDWHTTLAWLKTPDYEGMEATWVSAVGGCMSISQPSVSNSTVAKFNRVMRILGLKLMCTLLNKV
jgi:hypothetical protein